MMDKLIEKIEALIHSVLQQPLALKHTDVIYARLL